MVELHMKHNNLGRKRSTQRIQEKEAEDRNSSTSEEKIDDNNNNQTITTKEKCTKGPLEDINKHPSLNLFKVPVEKITHFTVFTLNYQKF